MSVRELIVPGTSSQVPTRHRNHNGYMLRWDGEGLLFDPARARCCWALSATLAERQLLLAGAPASGVTRLCLTHFHGDHCLGVPGVARRLSVDGVPRASLLSGLGAAVLRPAAPCHACVFLDLAEVRE